MYLPESHRQMYDILSDLRIYAAMNDMPHLAERLDDALMLLIAEGGEAPPAQRAGLMTTDTV